MAKFLNKKEQVFDIQLTTYGKYLMSIGKMQPAYYAFFDDNILYDKRYCTGSYYGTTVATSLHEPQNDIHKRIKQETPYLECLVQFTDIEDLDQQIENSGETQYVDATPQQQVASTDIFRYEKSIGDAYLESDSSNYAPAWKFVTLQNKISSSAEDDPTTLSHIPQINLTLNYEKEAFVFEQNMLPNSIGEIRGTTGVFADNHVIGLKTDDALIYLEEVNTALLVENFDIEVFEKVTVSNCAAADGRIGFSDFEQAANDDEITITHNGYTVTFTLKSSPDSGDDTEVQLVSIPESSSSFDYAVETLYNLLEAINNYGTLLDIEAVQEGNLYDSTLDPSIVLVASACSDLSNAGIISLNVDSESDWILDSWAGGTDETFRYKRKFFKKEYNNVQDGYMIANQPVTIPSTRYTTASVEYYFDVLVDQEIDNELACKGAQTFNKESYYVDLDFDCNIKSEEAIYFDIYGKATEPEICQ